MPIAAVPDYLGNNFSQASPGMRFGMYLPLWGSSQQREFKKEGSVGVLHQACAISTVDKQIGKAILQRQIHAFATVGTATSLRLQGSATAPFTTGLGNEHPLENGFAFLNPYGLPYLPGSGVKGVLRQAACELASGEWGTSDWSEDLRHEVLDLKGKHLMDASDFDVLFGLESADGAINHLRGALSFWDVVPQIEGNTLMVEIMTPHQSHYYQQKEIAGSTSPHDSGSPNPISFLTVPPGSGFTFHMLCDTDRLQHLAPDLAEGERWKVLLTTAFEHAFTWLGFGAKTSVGYGAMGRNLQAEERLSAALAKAQDDAKRAAKRASLSANTQMIEKFTDACKDRIAQLRGNKDKPNTELHARARDLSKAALEGADWTAEEKRTAAEALAEWLPKVVAVDMKDERKKLKLAALRGET